MIALKMVEEAGSTGIAVPSLFSRMKTRLAQEGLKVKPNALAGVISGLENSSRIIRACPYSSGDWRWYSANFYPRTNLKKHALGIAAKLLHYIEAIKSDRPFTEELVTLRLSPDWGEMEIIDALHELADLGLIRFTRRGRGKTLHYGFALTIPGSPTIGFHLDGITVCHVRQIVISNGDQVIDVPDGTEITVLFWPDNDILRQPRLFDLPRSISPRQE